MLRAVDQNRQECFEIWCWRRIEKICWTDHVRKEDVLLSVKEQSNILNEIPKWMANWIGKIWGRNCLLKRVTEEKIQGSIEVRGRQGKILRSYWMILREREDTLIGMRKLWISACGELAFAKALDQS
jgi:hypothetical protein